MSGKDDALRVTQDGITINVTSAVATATLLPLNSVGEVPRVVRLQVDTNPVHVRLGPASSGSNSAVVTPTLGSMLLTAYEPVLVNTKGQTYIGAITRAAGITSNLNVTPIED